MITIRSIRIRAKARAQARRRRHTRRHTRRHIQTHGNGRCLNQEVGSGKCNCNCSTIADGYHGYHGYAPAAVDPSVTHLRVSMESPTSSGTEFITMTNGTRTAITMVNVRFGFEISPASAPSERKPE